MTWFIDCDQTSMLTKEFQIDDGIEIEITVIQATAVNVNVKSLSQRYTEKRD